MQLPVHQALSLTWEGMQVTVPYLRSEYGKEYDFEAPVKLLDRMMHSMPSSRAQQVVVLGQVLASDVNIGYEEIVNTQVRRPAPWRACSQGSRKC